MSLPIWARQKTGDPILQRKELGRVMVLATECDKQEHYILSFLDSDVRAKKRAVQNPT